MDTTVFIVPGYNHCPADPAYQEIAKIITQQGLLPMPIAIPWKNVPISQGTDYFLRQIKKKSQKKAGKTYILGFSYGAMIAFMASTQIPVSGLILCSLSPYFREDLLKANRDEPREDFVNISCHTISKKIKAKKVMMLYGENEDRSLKHRVTEAFHTIPITQKTLMQIENTDHEIGNRRYLDSVSSVIHTLN